MDGEGRQSTDKAQQGRIEYVQNGEQNDSTVWKRLRNINDEK